MSLPTQVYPRCVPAVSLTVRGVPDIQPQPQGGPGAGEGIGQVTVTEQRHKGVLALPITCRKTQDKAFLPEGRKVRSPGCSGRVPGVPGMGALGGSRSPLQVEGSGQDVLQHVQ